MKMTSRLFRELFIIRANYESISKEYHFSIKGHLFYQNGTQNGIGLNLEVDNLPV